MWGGGLAGIFGEKIDQCGGFVAKYEVYPKITITDFLNGTRATFFFTKDTKAAQRSQS
jgi:hypothetical protein